MAINLVLAITPSQVLTPTFIPEIENHDQATIVHLNRKRREDEPVREPLAKSRSHAVRSC